MEREFIRPGENHARPFFNKKGPNRYAHGLNGCCSRLKCLLSSINRDGALRFVSPAATSSNQWFRRLSRQTGDGWALFVYQPWGEFDLRDGLGRFLPHREALGREPLEVFVSALSDPADALAEFIHLTGRPAMPPKWALGYFQSHRTLLGPEDALNIARTFREKQLPCDGLIYLGTGIFNLQRAAPAAAPIRVEFGGKRTTVTF